MSALEQAGVEQLLQKINYQMGITKTDAFTSNQNELATLFKAMAHPARIAIIEFLLQNEKCICGDIVDELPLAQATISQHLKELKNANLIKGTIEGTAICYCLNQEAFAELNEKISLITNQLINKNNNQCC
jgi:DNA-binding transcriptional ArsR family regulator